MDIFNMHIFIQQLYVWGAKQNKECVFFSPEKI